MALHDEGERREVTYEEARAVLEAQRETIVDVDEKAIWTVRITVLLIGVLISVWRIEPELFDPLFATLAAIVLVGSLAAGTFTYSESDLYLGPSKEYIHQLADGDFDGDDWERDLLYSFGEWISGNDQEIQISSQFLFVAQTALLCGIGLHGLSVLL